MDEEWRLEGTVDAHLEKTIIVLNLNISCGLPEIKCCILTWMELCCLTSEWLFGNMIRCISLGICSDALSQSSLAFIKVEALIGLSNFWDVCVSRHPYPYLCLKKQKEQLSLLPFWQMCLTISLTLENLKTCVCVYPGKAPHCCQAFLGVVFTHAVV